MSSRLERWIWTLRARRAPNLAVVNLRLLLGFAFLPAGLKKVLDEPFTDPANAGPFHDFLDAFHATGPFYQGVGAAQLAAAALLLTQRHATLGVFLATPILAAILTFCWSTRVYPTATVVTLMTLGALALLAWDLHKWRGVLRPDGDPAPAPPPPLARAPIDLVPWQACGLAILGLYLAACVITGEIYRPRGVELDRPVFYVLVAIALSPLVALAVERARRRRR